MTQPSRLIFWRSLLAVSAVLPFLGIWQLLGLARELDVAILASQSWMGLLLALGMTGLAALLALTLALRSSSGPACFRARERILDWLEIPARLRWPGVPLLLMALPGYTLFFLVPPIQNLLGDLGWVRCLVFWAFSLAGMYALKMRREGLPWLTAWLVSVTCQTAFHLLVNHLTGITAYPFAMGWSETSRYYYPSLFLSEGIFGTRLPWPILHPSLHLLLVPPYWFDGPLWLHRAWQVFLRFTLLGLTAFTLLQRLDVKGRALRWLAWAWMTLFLFQGPVYFHLTVPLILILWGFSGRDSRQTLRLGSAQAWLAVILASLWCGLSRINWYPVPGLLATVLFLLETPYNGKRPWRYLLEPVSWTVVGMGIAFATQRAYIALSGIPDPRFFYTSLTSNLLWYRLLPNASYFLGVLPGALLASLPVWMGMGLILRRVRLHPLRMGLILAILLAFFLGGLLVSMKIGGGVDIHNLDAYLGLSLVVFACLVFARYAPEGGQPARPISLPWSLVALLVVVPAWFSLQLGGGFKVYDAARTQSVLTELQARVDAVNAQGGEILFITQRHLVSMRMLEGVTMLPEYEREELMEMAMGDNQEYLQIFRADMEAQRFDMIVVDPLTYRLLGRNYAFGEENNAWVKRVMKPILCNYREEVIYPEDQIAIYVPQEGERVCP
ncbi:MAG: hypothetical protein ACOYYJ_02345 [Chloroflexota bacterium]